jgi:low affinity Fe/Cu permease
MGHIVFWAIIRAAIIIPIIWFAKPLFKYSDWWVMGILSLYAVILHPAIIQYQQFLKKNRPVLEGTLCSSCRHFDKTAVLCLKHDEHPTTDDIPCDGLDWEPNGV